MATEIRKVVSAGYEELYDRAINELSTIDNDVETKVAEYREKILAEIADKKHDLNESLICVKKIKSSKFQM